MYRPTSALPPASASRSIPRIGMTVGPALLLFLLAAPGGALVSDAVTPELLSGLEPGERPDPEAPELQAADSLRIRISPERLELPYRGEGRLQVEVIHPGGATLEGRQVVWNSQDPDVAMVGPSGQVTARAAGRAGISVVVDGQVARAVVEVLPPPPAELELSLPVDVVFEGTSAPLRLRAWGVDGAPVSSEDQTVFSSSDPDVARVDPGGRVHGVSPGTARLEAVVGEARAAVEVRVVENPGLELFLTPDASEVRTGDVVRFRLEGRGASDDPDPELFPAWSVSRAGAAVREEGGDGVFVAEEPGRYRVTATLSDRASRSVVVDVEPRSSDAVLLETGRGVLDGHHSGDMWVFEGADGRDYVYIGTFQHDWMKVFDVTDPASPILTDSIWMDARRINDMKIHPEGRLAVATREGASDRRNGIVILDASDPAHPTVLSEYTETVTGGVHNVWIEGDLVYACHNGTSDLHIIDVSDPENPREVGRWGLDRERKTLHDVIVQDGYAYLSYWDDGLVMLDVGAGTHGGTPTEPVQVSRFSYPQGHTHTAWRDGPYLFVGDEIFPADWDPTKPIEARGYIHVLEMSDPEEPVEVARYEVPEAGAHNVWVEDDLLYVGYYQAGLRVVDISGELRGDLYRQGRELAVLKTVDENSMVPNWPMTWGAQPFKGHIFSADLNSGLWVTRLEQRDDVVF